MNNMIDAEPVRATIEEGHRLLCSIGNREGIITESEKEYVSEIVRSGTLSAYDINVFLNFCVAIGSRLETAKLREVMEDLQAREDLQAQHSSSHKTGKA